MALVSGMKAELARTGWVLSQRPITKAIYTSIVNDALRIDFTKWLLLACGSMLCSIRVVLGTVAEKLCDVLYLNLKPNIPKLQNGFDSFRIILNMRYLICSANRIEGHQSCHSKIVNIHEPLVDTITVASRYFGLLRDNRNVQKNQAALQTSTLLLFKFVQRMTSAPTRGKHHLWGSFSLNSALFEPVFTAPEIRSNNIPLCTTWQLGH